MKKTITMILLAALVTSVLASCTPTKPEVSSIPDSAVERVEESAKESLPDEAPTEVAPEEDFATPDSSGETEEKVLPAMTAENQLLHDKYITDASYNVLGAAFAPDDFSDMNGLYLSFFSLENYKGEEPLTDTEGAFNAELFEATIQEYFNMPVETIREIGAYDASTNTYPAIEGVGGAPQYYIITDSTQEGTTLTMHYNHYWGEYIHSDDGVLVIEQGDNESFKYISNTIVAEYPQG